MEEGQNRTWNAFRVPVLQTKLTASPPILGSNAILAARHELARSRWSFCCSYCCCCCCFYWYCCCSCRSNCVYCWCSFCSWCCCVDGGVTVVVLVTPVIPWWCCRCLLVLHLSLEETAVCAVVAAAVTAVARGLMVSMILLLTPLVVLEILMMLWCRWWRFY